MRLRMSKRILRIIQILVFTVLIAVGIGLVSRWNFSPFPVAAEATHLLRAATDAECIGFSQWPETALAHPSPFHQAAGICARFFGEGKAQLPIRCYRVFPAILSILFLMALPALGLRRRGGVFESADGPLWALAFAVVSPTLVWDGGLFTSFSFQLFTVLAFLLAARSYAQWPGFASAVAAGAALAVSIALDANTLWFLVILLPTVAIGVGWRRLRLYWRTAHMLVAAAVLVAFVTLFFWLKVTHNPTMPQLPDFSAGWAVEKLHNLLWVSAGGLGVLAWVVLAILGGFRPERRWIRLLTLLFPCCALAGIFFAYGTIFWVAVAALSPILIGVMLSEVPLARLRGVQGVILWSGLAGWTYLVYTDAAAKLPSRNEVRDSLAVLAEAQTAPRVNPCRMRIYAKDCQRLAQMIWPVRYTIGKIEQGGEHVGGEADIVLVPEALVKDLPFETRAAVSLGRFTADRTTHYRIFSALNKEEKR